MKVQIPCFIKNLKPETISSVEKILNGLNLKYEIIQNFSCCGLPFFEKGNEADSKEIANFNVAKFKDDKLLTCNDKCYKTFTVYYPETLKNTVSHNDCFKLAENTTSIFQLMEKLELKKSFDFKGTYYFLSDCVNNFKPLLLNQFANIEWKKINPEQLCCGASEGFACNNLGLSNKMTNYILENAQKENVETIVVMNDICMEQLKKQSSEIKIIHYLDFIANAI